MNNSDILALTYELKEKIVDSNLYKDLKEKEKNMMDDEICCKLLILFEQVKEEYKDAKRFEKYGSNIEEVQKRLSKIKLEVGENILVKSYNEAYKKMKNELRRIQNIVFKDIIKERKEINIVE